MLVRPSNSVNYYFNLEELWDKPSMVPKSYTADGPYMLGNPIIDNICNSGNAWDPTS